MFLASGPYPHRFRNSDQPPLDFSGCNKNSLIEYPLTSPTYKNPDDPGTDRVVYTIVGSGKKAKAK